MGKKRTIIMDDSQNDELDQFSKNKYKKRDAFELPDEFAELEALYAKEKQSEKDDSEEKKTEVRIKKAKVRSKKFKALKKMVDPQKTYSLSEALDLILKLATRKFDESLELNLVFKKDSASGTIELPYGTGKEKKVVVFDEKVLADIEAKKIDFDVLLATPADMGKLAKHAKFLGPKGLMPNPKKGTITKDPQSAIKEFSGNKLQYKTERKAPLAHLMLGKISMGKEKLQANLEQVFKVISPKTLRKASIASTMSPGVKLNLEKLI